MEAEEAQLRIARSDFHEQMKLTKEQARATLTLKEVDAILKKARKDRKRDDKVLTAMVSATSLTLAMLGHGKEHGGIQQHQKNRQEVLERVREVAELSPEQTCHWGFFKLTWDQQMAEVHGVTWGGLFAEIIQKLLDDLLAGKTDALSVFMEDEKKRVLLAAPGG